MPDTDLMAAALGYAALQWYVFPIHEIVRVGGIARCGCGRDGCQAIGKHPRIKWSKGATCDPVEVRRLWSRWPNSGIGCATGPSKLVVFDGDGVRGLEHFKRLSGGERWQAPVARTSRGAHAFFAAPDGAPVPTSSDPDTKLDVRATGGFVVLAPSPHASGITYQWINPPAADSPSTPCPAPLLAYAREKKKRPSRGPAGALSAQGEGRDGGQGQVVNEPKHSPEGVGSAVILPEYLRQSSGPDFAMRVLDQLQEPDWGEVAAALRSIPANCKMDEWIRVGMALHQASKGSLQGLDIWDKWSSAGGDKYKGRGETEYKWSTFKQVPAGVGLGTLFALALQRGYKRGEVMLFEEGKGRRGQDAEPGNETRPPDDVRAPGAVDSKEETTGEHHANGHAHSDQSEFFSQFNSTPTNPLIRLNQEFAVIEDIGGKCRVMSWIPSPLDKGVRVPSFQDFRSFSERFGHKYITVKKTKHLKDGDHDYEEDVQLGTWWLKWTGRRTYRHLELAPNQPAELDNGNYNLWQGWGVMPARGRWDRMRDHIEAVLAGGDATAADYILKWSAWAVQNPGLPAKVALVLRGGKGAGKGAFLSAMRTLFGAHGLQIYNRAHLVGSFNAHLRNCLFLFADEAFWAGDKQGESVLKGLITEHVVVIEQKGVDGIAWPNRLKVAMAANNAWVVPASADERRYAVFDVSDSRKQDHAYFDALHEEMRAGGLEAMLWDLLTMNVGAWSPRLVPQTKALQDQKDLSMSPLMEWWYGLLTGDGELRFEQHPKDWPAHQLLQEVTECVPWARTSAKGLAAFMYERGAVNRHTRTGSIWTFPPIDKARAAFEKQFGPRAWKIGVEQWGGG
jgi:hypothetical protein